MTNLLEAHALLVIPSDDLRGMLWEPQKGGPPERTEYACGCDETKVWKLRRSDSVKARCNGCGERPGYYTRRTAVALRWEGEWMPHGWLAAGLACGWPPSTCLPLTLTPQRRFLLSLEARGCTLVALDKKGKEVNND
jgi:hypothetical protein